MSEIQKTIREGEVCTLKFSFEPRPGDSADVSSEDWLDITEGAFAAPAVDGLVPCRLTYEKRKRNEVFVTVDARASMPLVTDRPDPNGFLNEHFQIVPATQIVDCTLSIDLGNTRTVALLIDHVGDMSGSGGRLQIHPLPMTWSCANPNTQTGVFESMVSLICPDSAPGAFCGNESRLSFAKLGGLAAWNNRAKELDEAKAAGRYTLSSPKRYFWNRDPSPRNWMGAQYLQQEEDRSVSAKWLDGRLATRLGEKAGLAPTQLPPADILSAMVVELYEQAVHYVGSPEFKQQVSDDRCRRISQIHITYPSTLLPRERDLYRHQLEHGLAAYRDLYPGAFPVTVQSEIDEASAVLAVFAYSEMRACDALFWLQSIGRRSDAGAQARIAVIDVGGGTTDLSISSISANAADAGIDPFKAQIEILCRDGMNRAGDALMFDFITTCVAAFGFSSIWTATGVGEGLLKQATLKERYHAAENREAVRSLTRDFWFDFAIRVASECDRLVSRYPEGEIADADFPSFDYKLGESAHATWKKLFGEQVTVPETFTVRLTRAVFEQYRASVKKIFQPIARTFALSIYAYDADMLLFSGKTAEFQAVQDVFRKAVVLPASAIRSMKDFAVGAWCGSLTDGQGRISDSKISTALGGALYSLRTSSTVNLTFIDQIPDQTCFWGFVSEERPDDFPTPIFGEGEFEKDVPLGPARHLIARRTLFSRVAILSYELRFKPGVLERHLGLREHQATVRLVCHPDTQSLTVESCNGQYGDFTDVALDDIECRVCTMSGEFAMDRIVEI